MIGPISSQHIFNDSACGRSMPWLWRQLDWVAPTRRAKVVLLATTLSVAVVFIVGVTLVRQIDYAKTARLSAWSRIESASFRMSLVGMTRNEIAAKYGPAYWENGDVWVYRTGRKEGPPLQAMFYEQANVTFQSGVVASVEHEPVRWGCTPPATLFGH